MKKETNTDNNAKILNILINKYNADTEKFNSYLPEIAQIIEDRLLPPSKKSYTSKLTEIERERLFEFLLDIPGNRSITEKQSTKALEYCATLIQDGNLPDKIDRKVILGFLNKVIGTSISKINKKTTIPVANGEKTKTLAILRGVYLHLTWNDLLVAISISPTKYKDRTKALKFIGIGKTKIHESHQRYNTLFSGGI